MLLLFAVVWLVLAAASRSILPVADRLALPVAVMLAAVMARLPAPSPLDLSPVALRFTFVALSVLPTTVVAFVWLSWWDLLDDRLSVALGAKAAMLVGLPSGPLVTAVALL